ncbi:MAG: HEAT repeat domain-containing protein [Planctomycetota bacterium]
MLRHNLFAHLIVHPRIWLWALCLAGCLSLSSSHAQEANWIWSPEHPRGQATQGDCFFRCTMQLASIEQATVTLTADDEYELFVNGQKVGAGNSINQMEQYDVAPFLGRGRNVVAIRVRNLAPGPAALAARVFIKPAKKGWLSYSTNKSWRTSIDASSGWQRVSYNDSKWKAAQVYGVLGETAPWDRREESNPQRISNNQRFRISSEFAVDEILNDKETGSLINMAFNEFGHIVAAQENGPLLLIYDTDKDGVVDKVREYCDLVEHIQGILPLNGDVYVTGIGAEGAGVYQLIDKDRNGKLEEAKKIIGFEGESIEHGGHGLSLGTDGFIYCVLGNHVQFDGEFTKNNPVSTYYEGDLLTPKYEDPGGHASGVKAPGGTVIRFSVEGKDVQMVASGLRNAYDLVFHPDGRMFVHDSDMESDQGAVWYRPTSLYEIEEGAEFGWRSGWSKWPSYYLDRLPPVMETGRGSPTGACVYSHHMFPVRYQGCLFLADWTAGQIMCVRFKDGQPQAEMFIEGQPLNVTDLAVGPDGWLYFCTGGRGTKGGIYQVRWRGNVPDEVKNLGSGIAKAIKHPQLDAPWARQNIATLKRELGSAWGDNVAGVAFSDENPPKFRLRALDLMQLFGPTPTDELLVALCEASNAQVRARAAQIIGRVAESNKAFRKLETLLDDDSLIVRTEAAEALYRAGKEPEIESLLPMLTSLDRSSAWQARQLLQRIPTDQWKEKLLKNEEQRVQIQAGLALVLAEPTADHGKAVVAMAEEMLDGFISDRNFIDLLRLMQVTLHRCELKKEDVPELTELLIAEFPIGEPKLNRELFHLLTYLNAEEVISDAISSLQSDLPVEDRIQIAMNLRFFDHKWSSDERFAIIKFFEETQLLNTGSSVPLYVMNVTKDIAKDMPLEEAKIFVAQGTKWPNAALVSLYQFSGEISDADLKMLIRLDEEIDGPGYEGEAYKRLKTGIVAMLTMHGGKAAMQYLREVWIRSPERRQAVAMGLATQPTDDNFDYLVRSLPVLETYAVPEVLKAIRKIPAATDDAQALREVILHGLRMQGNGRSPALAAAVLKYWTGQDASGDEDDVMGGWQAWYSKKFPDLPEAELPTLQETSAWTVDNLEEFFSSSDGRFGALDSGKLVYEKADCSKCHTMNGVGTAVGPDLSTLTGRFTRKEVLQAILYPSHVISDQYRSKKVLTDDGLVYSGIVTENSDGSVAIKDSQLQTHVVPEEDVNEIQVSKASLMPSGLLDELTAVEIRDLMTYMGFGRVEKVAGSEGEVRNR